MANKPILTKKACINAVPNTPCTTVRMVLPASVAKCSPPFPARVTKIDMAVFSDVFGFIRNAPAIIIEIINRNRVVANPVIPCSIFGAISLS